MLPDTPPVLHLIAGINGAGKTSFYQDFLRSRTPGAELVNADEIARERWPMYSTTAGSILASLTSSHFNAASFGSLGTTSPTGWKKPTASRLPGTARSW